MATARRIRTVAEHHIVYHWIAYEERRLITRHTKHTGHNARAIHPSAYLPSIITLASICLDDFQPSFSWYRTPINKQSLSRHASKLSRETPLEKKKKKTIDPPTDRTVDVFFLANIRTCNSFLFTAHTTHYIPFPLSSYFDFFSMTSLTRVVASFTSLYHHRLVPR